VEPSELNLTGDDSSALSILLYIAHLHFDMLPTTLSLEQLLVLAVITNKYEATRAVRPFLQNWLPVWTNASAQRQISSIWIAWEFGLLEDFKRAAAALVMNAEIKDDPKSLIYNWKELSEYCPPDLIGTLTPTFTRIAPEADVKRRKCS
jgi:hypothetical protein